MKKIVSKLVKKKLRKMLLSNLKKFRNPALREAGKYSLVLFIFINVTSAAGFYVEGDLSKRGAEQALLGFNERIERSYMPLVSEIGENIAFLEVAPIELPSIRIPEKRVTTKVSVKENSASIAAGVESAPVIFYESASELDLLSKVFVASFQATIENLKKVVSQTFENSDNNTSDNDAVVVVESVSDKVPEKAEELDLLSNVFVSSFQATLENLRKIFSRSFDGSNDEGLTQSRDDIEMKTVESVAPALFTPADVNSNFNSFNTARTVLPSLTPSLLAQIESYVSLEIMARENLLLAKLRESVTRQSDADADRRSVIINNITQEADLTSPDITGGTLTNTVANLASLTGAGLSDCQSNNVLTWAGGMFGCETDDSGGGGGGSGNSKWATSTPTTDITPNGAIGVVMTRSTTTNATTTTFFSSTASSTNLFATALNAGNATLGAITSGTINSQTISSVASFTGTLNVTSGLTTLSNLLLTGSTTLQNFTFVRATGTAATTTSIFAAVASSTQLWATTATFANLFANTANLTESGNLFYTDARVQSFVHGSTTIPKTYSANTFTGAQIFDNITRSTTTAATTTRFAISSITSSLLKTAADGSLLAATAGTDYENTLTFGDGLTRTANDVDCDTASLAVFGCLLAADWGLFNNKVSTTSIDTIAEVETLWSVSNILIEADIDASSELLALMDDETGTGALVFGTLPSLGGFISTASSTVIGNFNITGNSTSTNATTTNLNVSNDLSVGSTAGTGDSVFQLANDTDAWSLGYYSVDKTFRIASSTNLTSNVYFQIGKSGTTTLSSGLGLESGSDEALCIDPTTFEITRGGASCAASSLRFKEKIENLSYGLEAVRRLRPISYQYKESERPGDDSRYLGFIAEEVIEVIPEVVEIDGEGLPGGIDYAKLAPVFAKAIQEIYDGALSRVREWLADATNGITSLFAEEVHTEMLCVRKSDGSNVCVTGDQLSALLSGASISEAAPVIPPPAPESEPELPKAAPESDLEPELESELPETVPTAPESAEPAAAESTSEPVSETPAQ